MEEVSATASPRKIRLSYSDPDATDSSSDESTPPERKCKRIVHELALPLRSGEDLIAERKFVGAHKRKSGRYSAEVRDPRQKKRIWLGTFSTAEEASKAYLTRKREIEEGILWIAPSDHKLKLAPDPKIGFLCGLQIVDTNGFLVGEFSKLDDFSISTAEDGVVLPP